MKASVVAVMIGKNKMTDKTKGLEIKQIDGQECLIGRDPRQMSVNELNALGHVAKTPKKLIREHCIECCGDMPAEVRRCVVVKCVFWPYRMSKNPFSTRKGNPEALKALHKK